MLMKLREILTAFPLAPAAPSVPGFPWEEKRFSLTRGQKILRNDVYATTSLWKWSHLGPKQSIREGYCLLTEGPAGPAGPGLPGSPRDPAGPSDPRAPWAPASPWVEENQRTVRLSCPNRKRGCDPSWLNTWRGMKNTSMTEKKEKSSERWENRGLYFVFKLKKNIKTPTCWPISTNICTQLTRTKAVSQFHTT